LAHRRAEVSAEHVLLHPRWPDRGVVRGVPRQSSAAAIRLRGAAMEYEGILHPRPARQPAQVRRCAGGAGLGAFASVSLSGLAPVAKIAVGGALHDGLRARELYVWAKALGEREIHAADEQKPQLGIAHLLVELSVAASRNINGECVL